MPTDEYLNEFNEAVRRAGTIVTEHIDSIIETAEQEAETIRLEAERDAEDMQRKAVDAAKRLLDRLHALEFPLGELVAGLRDEVDQVSRELGRGEHVDSDATSLPPVSESAEAEAGGEAVSSEPGSPAMAGQDAFPAGEKEEEPGDPAAAERGRSSRKGRL